MRFATSEAVTSRPSSRRAVCSSRASVHAGHGQLRQGRRPLGRAGAPHGLGHGGAQGRAQGLCVQRRRRGAGGWRWCLTQRQQLSHRNEEPASVEAPGIRVQVLVLDRELDEELPDEPREIRLRGLLEAQASAQHDGAVGVAIDRVGHHHVLHVSPGEEGLVARARYGVDEQRAHLRVRLRGQARQVLCGPRDHRGYCSRCGGQDVALVLRVAGRGAPGPVRPTEHTARR